MRARKVGTREQDNAVQHNLSTTPSNLDLVLLARHQRISRREHMSVKVNSVHGVRASVLVVVRLVHARRSSARLGALHEREGHVWNLDPHVVVLRAVLGSHVERERVALCHGGGEGVAQSGHARLVNSSGRVVALVRHAVGDALPGAGLCRVAPCVDVDARGGGLGVFDVCGGGWGGGGWRGGSGRRNGGGRDVGARTARIGACKGDGGGDGTAVAEHAGHLDNAGASEPGTGANFEGVALQGVGHDTLGTFKVTVDVEGGRVDIVAGFGETDDGEGGGNLLWAEG